MVARIDNLLDRIREYDENYRSEKMGQLEISEPYDISPEKEQAQIRCRGKWPEMWPYARRAGIYAFVDENLEVVYVGKASLKNSLGARISSYCGYAPDRSCQIYDGWTNFPRYLVTVAVPEETPFEAPALEEFLISRLQPKENSRGREV